MLFHHLRGISVIAFRQIETLADGTQKIGGVGNVTAGKVCGGSCLINRDFRNPAKVTVGRGAFDSEFEIFHVVQGKGDLEGLLVKTQPRIEPGEELHCVCEEVEEKSVFHGTVQRICGDEVEKP